MEETNWQIGMWGPSAAGKTTYLASLYLHRKAKGWDIDVLDQEDKDTVGFIDREVSALAKGQFPSATAAGTLRQYRLHITRPVKAFLGRRRNSYTVSMIDISGEDIVSGSSYRDIYFDSLKQCQGLVMLIDPEEPHGTESPFGSYFSNLFNLIQQVDSTELRLAVCITKVDLDRHWAVVSKVSETNREGYQENLHDYLKQIIGRSAYEQIEDVFGQHRGRLFAVSSVGRYESVDGERPNVVREYGQSADARIIHLDNYWQPINIFQPLEWIFDNVPTV
jgi:GTPase SAR1 family protein